MKILKPRLPYLIAFVLLFITEVLIALFVRDRFIRPYGGDILVTVLICCLVRIFAPRGLSLLPLYVFLFASAVEMGQAVDFVNLLGLGDNAFFRTLLGTTFSLADLICYAVGCALFALVEATVRRKFKK